MLPARLLGKSPAPRANPQRTPVFSYHPKLDGQGSFSACVKNEDDQTVFEIKNDDIFQGGFMRGHCDLAGLKTYLTDLGILPSGGVIRMAMPEGKPYTYSNPRYYGFARVAAGAARRGAYSPRGVAAAVGRQKYGAKGMAALAALGRRLKREGASQRRTYEEKKRLATRLLKRR
jgi:hypothetical protein